MTTQPGTADIVGNVMASSTSTPVSVLVVDDNASKRLAIEAILAPLGYVVLQADSGVAGLRQVMTRDFAVILLDVRMPGMDGFETAALIRLRKQSEATPIIFITALSADEIGAVDRYAQGAVDFITSPVHPDELRAKVAVFANIFVTAASLATQARELKASADQLRLLTEAAPIGIFQTDAENRYVYVNPRWAAITGMSPADAIGEPWDVVIEPGQGTSDDPVLGDAGEAGEFSHRFDIAVADAEPRVVVVTSKPICDEQGVITGWVGTLAEITAVAKAEAAMSEARDEATAASQLKSDFLANMSHEIRTPMNGVLGITDLLLETGLDMQQRDYALTVRNSGEALLTVINDILDFSKIETGKLEIEDISFSVASVVNDVVDLLKLSAQAKGLELVSVVDERVPEFASGDPGRVRQVLTNLVGNAIKFTQVGHVEIGVTATEGTDSRRVVRFEVSDTGVGIATEKQAMIFDPFAQADMSTSRQYGGTGLGLAISGQLVALMDGDVGVKSIPGEGSTFWFTVSVSLAEEPSPPRLRDLDEDLVGVRALVVRDDLRQRDTLSAQLSGWGMSVEVVASVQAALGMLEARANGSEPFAVAVIDASMPGMNTLRAALEGVEPISATRLVATTGLILDRDRAGVALKGHGPLPSGHVDRERLRHRLRVALGLQVPIPPSPIGSQLSPTPAHPGRLLLAEDNLINQKVALAMLSGAGYHVDTVLNGRQAVEAAADQRYDAILMDCQMPEMNGYEATAAIRAQDGASRHTPVIALTAGARHEDRERCMAASMDHYLSKPITKDALLDIVRQSMEPILS